MWWPGAPGGTRTHTGTLLRGLPLPIGLRGRDYSLRSGHARSRCGRDVSPCPWGVGSPERLAAVEELTPNGGSHLADKITRLDDARSTDAELLARIDQLIAQRGGTTVTNVITPPGSEQ